MDYLDLNLFSTLSGVAAVLIVAYFRLHWPFRFQYLAWLFKSKRTRLLAFLEASYRKNKTRSVAMLDKSTHEILSGNYDVAEKFIAQGLTACKEAPSLFNQAMVHYLFYNLSTVYFYRGKYDDALDVAFRVYERDRSLSNALGIIVCAHARMGDIEHAWEAYQLLPKKRSRVELKLICLAEIEAARGNFERAISHLHKLQKLRYVFTLNLTYDEIEKRLKEWTKASTQAG